MLRSFIVSFFLLDKTMAIWEPKRDNSGMEHGTFLERTRVANPVTGKPYAETDMQVPACGHACAHYGAGGAAGRPSCERSVPGGHLAPTHGSLAH